MATAKQRAWRAKFARLYGGGRKRARSKMSGGGSMARRGRGRKRGFGGGGMMTSGPIKGFKVGRGIVGALLTGAIAGYAVQYLPINVPYKNLLAGFAVGGIAGAGGAYVAQNYLGMGGAASSGDMMVAGTQRVYS